MATRKLKLTQTEDREYHTRLVRLKQLGVRIGAEAGPSPERDRFQVEQIDRGFARLYELPSGEVAVVIPLMVTLLTSGVLLTDREIITLDDDPLELSDPTEWKYYEDVIAALPSKLAVLNQLLTSSNPLPRCQVSGVIVANGWSVVPAQWHNETLLTVELLLRDEKHNEFCFEFEVRLDRSITRKYELLRERLRVAPLTKRGGLYAPEREQLRDQKSVPFKEAFSHLSVSDEQDEELQKPN